MTHCTRRIPSGRAIRAVFTTCSLTAFILVSTCPALADSVNSPNIAINVDTNRATGNGAGNMSIAINTITIAETMLPEYSSGTGKSVSIKARPGYQFDPTSNVTAQSATIGINGAAINVAAVLTPNGSADEVLTFNFTSGTNSSVQDIIRINGVRVRILSAAGAAGPAQTTMSVTTSPAGGAFTDQGIVAANITKGRADRLVFTLQPGSVQSGADLLPAVTMVDFGGNVVTNDPRQITLTIQNNPAAGTLAGVTSTTSINGVATWLDDDNLRIATAGNGYTLRAAHDGADFQTSDTVTSGSFNILPGTPNQLSVSLQPVNTAAGEAILINVSVLDAGDNLVTNAPVDVTLTSAINPGGWPLLTDTSLTKTTVNGVASWQAADNLRINKETAAYKLAASGLSDPVQTDPFNITPADADHVAIVEQPVDTTAGQDILISVQVLDEFNNLNTVDATDITLALSNNPGNGTLETASSLTKTSSNGVAIWGSDDDLRINAAANGYRILASGVGAASESNAFNILTGGLDHLTITQQPATSMFNDDLLITVETRDALENLIDVTGEMITLSLSVNPAGTTLEATGGLTKSTTNGVVSWSTADDLRIADAAVGYRISASNGNLTVESQDFDITAPPPVMMNPGFCGTGCGAGSTMAFIPLLLVKLARRRIHRPRR